MDRREREKLIDQLRAENAESLLEIARREASIEDQNTECDQLLAKLAARRQQPPSNSAGLIVKDFSVERQLAPPEPAPATGTMSPQEQEPWDRWLRTHLYNQEQHIFDETARVLTEVCGELRTAIGDLERRAKLKLDALEARIARLEATAGKFDAA